MEVSNSEHRLLFCAKKCHEDPEPEIYRTQLKDSSWMFFGRVVT